MAFFSNNVQPAAPGTTNDALTLTGGAGRKAAIHEISLHGLGTSSTANELGVYRPGALGVTPTNQTSQKLDPDSGTPSATVATSWVTQPSLGSVPILRLGCNSNGGIYRWVAKPGTEIVARGDSLSSHSQVSLRFTTGGGGPMGVGIIFEEF